MHRSTTAATTPHFMLDRMRMSVRKALSGRERGGARMYSVTAPHLCEE